MADHEYKKRDLDDFMATTEDSELPVEYRKADKTKTWGGYFYDALDIEDPCVQPPVLRCAALPGGPC